MFLILKITARSFLTRSVYLLLTSLVYIPYYHAQPSAGEFRILKTQGTNEYANVHCGLMDKTGKLWFGTTGEGVYCYDGRSFLHFTKKDGLSDNTVSSVAEDKAGRIWFGTNTGVCRYNPSNNSFTSVAFSTNAFCQKKAISDILLDKDETLWFSTSDDVYCYSVSSENEQAGICERFLDRAGIKLERARSLNAVECISQDKAGNIWFGRGEGKGIFCFDGTSLTNLFTPGLLTPNGVYGRVMSVCEARDGKIWFGTGQGACRYDPQTKIFTNITQQAGLDLWVYSVIEDKAGNFWLATEKGSGEMNEDGGLWRFDGRLFTGFTTKDGLPHNGVFCTVEDGSGNLWIGTRNMGLCRYDGKAFVIFSN